MARDIDTRCCYWYIYIPYGEKGKVRKAFLLTLSCSDSCITSGVNSSYPDERTSPPAPARPVTERGVYYIRSYDDDDD